MNLTDFLLMKNGNTVKPDADLFDILLAKKLSGGAGVITTLTGNPLNFLVKKAQTAISTKISMSPIQEGTGDPSPTNIRPITGRTSVSLTIKDGEEVTQDEITISFGETVYGGTLDVETGVLTVNKGYVDMGDISWQKASGASSPSGYIFRSATAYTISRSTEILSSIYKTGNWQYTSQVKNNGICANSSGQILVRNDTYDNDVKAFTTAMSGVQLVYELATPRTIQLTPSEVQLLKGVNNLWTDGDEIELTYKA